MKTVSDDRVTDHPLWPYDVPMMDVRALITVTPEPNSKIPAWVLLRIPFNLKNITTDKHGQTVIVFEFTDEYCLDDEQAERDHLSFAENKMIEFVDERFPDGVDHLFSYEIETEIL